MMPSVSVHSWLKTSEYDLSNIFYETGNIDVQGNIGAIATSPEDPTNVGCAAEVQ